MTTRSLVKGVAVNRALAGFVSAVTGHDPQAPRRAEVTCRTSRSQPATANTPIIAITSFALSGDDQRAKEAGASAYLAKPYSPFDLLTMIRKLLPEECGDGGGWMGGDMKRTGWLLIGLLLVASLGCARRDWVGDMLVLTDVTGTWTGSLTRSRGNPSATLGVLLTLRQSGSRVTGEVAYSGTGAGRAPSGAVSGAVNGDVLSLDLSPMGQFELTVDEDEIAGQGGVGAPCPCQVRLERLGARPPRPGSR